MGKEKILVTGGTGCAGQLPASCFVVGEQTSEGALQGTNIPCF